MRSLTRPRAAATWRSVPPRARASAVNSRGVAGLVSQGAGERAFADAARPGYDEVAAVADPFTSGELANERTDRGSQFAIAALHSASEKRWRSRCTKGGDCLAGGEAVTSACSRPDRCKEAISSCLSPHYGSITPAVAFTIGVEAGDRAAYRLLLLAVAGNGAGSGVGGVAGSEERVGDSRLSDLPDWPTAEYRGQT